MGKLNIIDDLIAPADRIKIKYTGTEPVVIMGMAPDMIKNIMKIPSKDLLETDIRWDVSSDPNEFYGVWMGKRKEDNWSTVYLRVIVQGFQHSKEKTGWFVVEIKGTLETKYEFSNFIQRGFWWTYNLAFYYKQRRNYLEMGKDNIYEMRDFILNKFKINKAEE
ncbi:MAG TPA: hypothetical protein HA230_04850 [Candidatus Aenigmarchaeota archaeon]|nr:hypothetical protein [Candidatus Aenigmarchaeota archaeon]